ncbi:hypothetical protein TRIP_C90130 [Candidatus Zixiibacteriota bacterium]|nr:hypothetical protein TRIP_C90130 [candidate division Zixibacteria bacterium]
MLADGEKAYFKALEALKNKDYRAASGFFKTAENQFTERLEFRILQATTALLLAVKEEIFELENSRIEIEEISSYGKETEFRG